MSAPTVERSVTEVVDLSDPRPRRRRRRRVALVIVLILLAVAAVWTVWFSSILSVRQVRVVGADAAMADAALAAAAVPTGVPLARIDAARAERAVDALPWVAAAEVRRGWPSEVVVAVTPRVPIAVRSGTRSVVDADGVAFDAVGPLPKDLPKVTAEGVALAEAMAVLSSLPPDLARRVVAVSATTRDDVDLTFRSGDLIRWGSAGQAEFKAEVLRALMQRRADLYDVSAPELPTTFRAR
jgi:cell division protein FtsQ